ncbi:MAG TPA: NAD(P)/FAD-dependent oxidoreductase [Phycisphaeraceae bacterium]
MERCDALIVGGGPAGSTCAWKLRQAGLNVVVLDKQAFPRDKVCAGWITPAVVRSLELDFHDYQQQGRTLEPLTRFRVGMIGKEKMLEVDRDQPVSYGIRRCEFDDYLLRRSGASLRCGQGVRHIERTARGWCVNDEIEAPLLIGAGGHACPVARRLNAADSDQPQRRPVVAQEVEFELTPHQQQACRVRPDTPELFFCPDLSGYGWCFRKGSYLNIGLGRQGDAEGLGQQVHRFVEMLKAQGRVPANTPSRFKGHAYLLYGRPHRRWFDDGAILIGDAAGLAYPQSGEGIRTAVESALLAARTILDAKGDYRADRLARYAQLLEERWGRPAGDAAWLPRPWRIRLAAWLLQQRWFVDRVLLDRWFLRRGQHPWRWPAGGCSGNRHRMLS